MVDIGENLFASCCYQIGYTTMEIKMEIYCKWAHQVKMLEVSYVYSVFFFHIHVIHGKLAIGCYGVNPKPVSKIKLIGSSVSKPQTLKFWAAKVTPRCLKKPPFTVIKQWVSLVMSSNLSLSMLTKTFPNFLCMNCQFQATFGSTKDLHLLMYIRRFNSTIACFLHHYYYVDDSVDPNILCMC